MQVNSKLFNAGWQHLHRAKEAGLLADTKSYTAMQMHQVSLSYNLEHSSLYCSLAA